MGLDQYAYAKEKKGSEDNFVDLAYWRKHNALQGWMENLFRLRGGQGSFNCQDVYLSAIDIDLLESVVKSDSLPQTEGFFFGEDSSQDKYKKETTLEFIKDARTNLELGKEICYSSNW